MIGGLSEEEAKYILDYIQPDFIGLEWGAGTSTKLFGEKCKEYYSIEHDKSWYEKTKSNIDGVDGVSIYHIPNNQPRTKPTKKEEFLDYVEFPSK